MIVRRSAVELEKLRRSGLLVYRILEDLKAMVVEGVTTQDLEAAAEKMISDAGRETGVQRILHPGFRDQIPVCPVYVR